MGLFSKLINRSSKSDIRTSADLDRFLLNTRSSSSGIKVTEQVALESAAFFASLRVISEAIAQLPGILYERTGEQSKKRATEHSLYSVLHDSPNEFQTAFEFRQLMMINAQIYGVAYAKIVRVGGQIKELLPIMPGNIKVTYLDNYQVQYEIKVKGEFKKVSNDKIFKLTGFPGDFHRSPLDNLNEVLGLSIATQRYGSQLFSNQGRPGGIITVPDSISEEARMDLSEQWDDSYTGTNAGKTAFLPESTKFEAINFNAEDSQYLETRKFQRSEIAGALGVSPHKIGDLEHATFSNIEHQSLEFVINTVLPWAVRWEQAVHKYLLNPQERKKYFFELLIDGLLRGDIKSRSEAYRVFIELGIMNVDEARARENLDAREDGRGGVYMRPANLVPADKEPEEGNDGA